MAYVGGSRLPAEAASKLGHLNVVKSEWIHSLIQDFESVNNDEYDIDDNMWEQLDIKSIPPLKYLWAVDGSYVTVKENKKEVAFVKTALMTIEQDKISKINKEFPHPLQLQEIMTDSALFHATIFPLKNVKSSKGNLYDTVRHTIYDSIKIDENGAYFETLKWLVYEKWNNIHINSPSFECPFCDKKVEYGLKFDRDKDICECCGNEILLTDMIGFHLDMNDDNAPEKVASAYMAVMELLMLFTIIRLYWQSEDKNVVSEMLFIKDGPLFLGGQYSKLVPRIRDFLEHAKTKNRPINIIGCEKTGKFFDHLSNIQKYIDADKNDNISYSVLNHGYIRKEVQRMPEHLNAYGLRTNWGEKVYVKVEHNTYMVLNMTTGEYKENDTFPVRSDIIGLQRILATIPTLISRKYEGALYPVELVNGIASMSNYPSAKILQDFIRGYIN